MTIAAVGLLLCPAARGAMPKAYLPQMMPLTRVDPVYPESARVQHIPGGSVSLLVTINPQGHVVEAEVLTGPKAFHQAAIDAIMQWTFRPVIRNGKPIFAMSDQGLSFLAMGERPGSPGMSEAMSAFHRMDELRARFPRSPAQILADAEQQNIGATGEEGFYNLTSLVGLAFTAGDYKKANDYALQLLAMAAQFKENWNYGNAVHDGNMILGRIALIQGDVPAAGAYLIAGGHTPGSPQLNSFGPNVILAKELIKLKQRDTVLQYFDLCRAFWKMDGKQLDEWSATVRDGGMPDFGVSLH